MRRLLTVLASSAVFSFGLLAFTAGDARADEPAVHPTAPAASAAAGEKPQANDDADDVKHISLELNPLGLSIGRYSIQGEYMLARHHAVTLNPFFTSTSVKVNGTEVGSLSGFGGELGYRFYTGSKGANGLFVGPVRILFEQPSRRRQEPVVHRGRRRARHRRPVHHRTWRRPRLRRRSPVHEEQRGARQYQRPQSRELRHRRQRRPSARAPRGRLLVLRARSRRRANVRAMRRRLRRPRLRRRALTSCSSLR
jgi:hypothetical protein